MSTGRLIGWLLACFVARAIAQWQLTNEQYSDVIIRNVTEDGSTSVAKQITQHLLQLTSNQDTWEVSTEFTVVSPAGEVLYNLLVSMPQPPSRRYQRVLAGYRPRNQELAVAEVCEYTSYVNPLGESLDITTDLNEPFPEITPPPGAKAAVGALIVGSAAVVGGVSLLGGMFTGATTGYCPTTFGVCLCPVGQCIPEALNNLTGRVGANEQKIESLFELTTDLFNEQIRIDFQIAELSAQQQAAIEAQRDVSVQLDQTLQYMSGSLEELTDAFYNQADINELNQAQLDKLNVAVEQGLIATEILAQRTQEEIDEINAFITTLATDTQDSFDYMLTIIGGQNAAIQESFNLTYEQLDQIDFTLQEVADRTNFELRILQNNVKSLAQQSSNMYSLMFQQQENNGVRDILNIALRELVEGVIDKGELFPFIEDLGIPYTNVTNAPYNFTRFPLEQLSYLTVVDYQGDKWWYEISYNMFLNPYFVMNAANNAPDFTQLLQILHQNSQLPGCMPSKYEDSSENSGCTIWMERTLIRCIADANYETMWQDTDLIKIDFDTMCDPSSFTQVDFDNQLALGAQYEVFTNATELVRDIRHTALGWTLGGEAGGGSLVPLEDVAPLTPRVYPFGAVRATSRRAGTWANVQSFDAVHIFSPVDELTRPYPRGNDPVSYLLRIWESSYSKTIFEEIYRLRVGTKGTLPTGGVETSWRPFAARDPNTQTAAGCYRSIFASTSNTDAETDPVYRFIPDSIYIPITLTKLVPGDPPVDVTNDFLDNIINFDDPLAAGVIPVEPAMSGAFDLQDGGTILDTPQSVMSFAVTPSSRDYLYSLFPRAGQTPETFGFGEWADLYGGEFWDPLKMLPTAVFYERTLEEGFSPPYAPDVTCSTQPPNENALPNEWCLILDNYFIREVQGFGECDPSPCPDRYGPNAENDCSAYCEFFEYVDFIPKQFSISLQLATEEDFNLVQQANTACPEVTQVYDAATKITSMLATNNNPVASISARFEYETDPPLGCPGLLPTDFAMTPGSTKAFDFTPCLENVDVTASIYQLTGELCSTIDFTAPQRNTFIEVQLGNPATYGGTKRVELDSFNNATWDTLGSWAASTDIFLTQPILPPDVFDDLFAGLAPNPDRQAALDNYRDLWDVYFPLLQNTTASLNFTIQAYQQNLNTSDNLLDALIPYIQNGSALLEENRRLGEEAALLNQELQDNIQNATYYLDNVNESINQTAELIEILNEQVYNASVEVEILFELVKEFNETYLESVEEFQKLLDELNVVTGAGWSTSSTTAFTISIIALAVGLAALGWSCARNPPLQIQAAPAATSGRHSRYSGVDYDHSIHSGTKGAGRGGNGGEMRRRINTSGTDTDDSSESTPLFY